LASRTDGVKTKALIMAGGKATRMKGEIEKPLIDLDGIRLIGHVIESTSKVKDMKDIFVAISKNTPKTKRFLSEHYPHVNLIETSGAGYHQDMVEAIIYRKLYFPILVISSDMPLMESSYMDKVIGIFSKEKCDSLSVFIRAEKQTLHGSHSFDLEGEMVVPAGINIINGISIGSEEIPQYNLIEDYDPHFININTEGDLDLARAFLSSRK